MTTTRTRNNTKYCDCATTTTTITANNNDDNDDDAEKSSSSSSSNSSSNTTTRPTNYQMQFEVTISRREVHRFDSNVLICGC